MEEFLLSFASTSDIPPCHCDSLIDVVLSPWTDHTESPEQQLKHHKVLLSEATPLHTRCKSSNASRSIYHFKTATNSSTNFNNEISFPFKHQTTPEKAINDYKRFYTYNTVQYKSIGQLNCTCQYQFPSGAPRDINKSTLTLVNNTAHPLPQDLNDNVLRPKMVIIGETQQELLKRSVKEKPQVMVATNHHQPTVNKKCNTLSIDPYLKMFWISSQSLPLMKSRSLDAIAMGKSIKKEKPKRPYTAKKPPPNGGILRNLDCPKKYTCSRSLLHHKLKDNSIASHKSACTAASKTDANRSIININSPWNNKVLS
jgi:hypothetical protein